MKIEYEQPFAEIVDFLAMEQLASAQANKDARDSGGTGTGTGGGYTGTSENVEEDW